MSAGTPVIFDDGSKAFVPQDKLSAAIKDGGKVAQFMQFDDGSKAYVPLDKVHDAIHDGGMLMGAPPQAPRISMQEQTDPTIGEDLSRYASEAAPSVVGAGKNLANQVYDVSAPNIAHQVYRHMRGLPNTLKELPPKMVLAFLAAGGLGEEGLADTADKPEAAATTGAESAQPATAAPSAAPPATSAPPAASAQPAATPEPIDPLLARLSKIASDIQDKEAAEAAKKAARRGSVKVPAAPVVPQSDAEMFRLLKQSLAQAEQRNTVQ